MSRGRDGRRHSRSRTRSRSRSRGRSSSPRRGVSDVTSDPKTVNARIFVGSINASMTREMLQEYFSQYGRVVGVSITRNKFGFVQFEKEEEATACLNAGNSVFIMGNRIDVKPAKFGGGPGEGGGGGSVGGGGGSIGSGGGGGGMKRPRYSSRDRDRSPGRGDDYYNSYYNRGGMDDRSLDRDARDRHYDQMYEDYYREYYQRYQDSYHRMAVDSGRHSSTSQSYGGGGGGGGGGSGGGGGGGGSGYSEPLDPLDPARPNDVEIVVPNKMQRSYAENIEMQLKSFNLLVDLLFPPPDISPSQVLSDLTQRHCLYAIFVTGENENHRSLTLNILHGTPQEHRNMPVDGALRLIEQNFGEYVKKVRQRNMREVVPRDIHNLLCDLLENRQLSMGDLDKVIKYLKERQSILVDDQIEQKRETAAGASASRPLAVTYPGYNYGSTSVVGSGNPVSQSTSAAVTGSAGAVSMVPPPSAAAAAAAVSGTAYPSFGSGAYGAYSMSSQMQAAPVAAPMLAQGSMGSTANKQSELQERILNLMKGPGAGGVPTGVPPPSGVPPPTGVPPPSGVPHPSMVPPVWPSGASNKAGASSLKPSQSGPQGQSALFAAYTPWNQ